MVRSISVAVALAACACRFSSPGGKSDEAPGLGEPTVDRTPGDAPPSGDAPDGDAEDAGSDADGGQTPSDGGTGEPGDQPLPPPSDPPGGDDGDAEGSGGDDGMEGGTGDVAECDLGGLDILWAEDAVLTGPMGLAEATEANDTPKVAVSNVAEQGEVVFELDLPCAGDYYVWGLVWDFSPGAWPDPDPDSVYVDAGGEFVWRYGCQTSTEEGGLSWQPLERLDDQPCATTPIVLQAPAPGVYALPVRNREAGSGSVVAGIAAIAIGPDPTLDPYDVYSPY